MRHSLLLLGFSGLATGCGREVEPAERPVVRHMNAHYARTADLQTSAIVGDLGGVRRAARWLATHEPIDPLPGGSRHLADSMRTHAAAAADASDLHEAAAAISRTAASCGACHRSFAIEPGLFAGSEPPPGHDPASHMARHIWAADRLWEALIGPSDTAWQAGVLVLSDAPLHTAAMAGDDPTADTVRHLADRVHALGLRAGSATTLGDRAEVYAELLATCDACHGQLGVDLRR